MQIGMRIGCDLAHLEAPCGGPTRDRKPRAHLKVTSTAWLACGDFLPLSVRQKSRFDIVMFDIVMEDDMFCICFSFCN